jgi:hypothetical protein
VAYRSVNRYRGPAVRAPGPVRLTLARHIARLVTRLAAPLVVDYSGLVIDYFTSAARRRLLRLAQARRRLLRLRRAARCLGTSHGSSRHSSSTTSPTSRVRVPRHVARPVTGFVVDYSVRRNFLLRQHWLYFEYAARRHEVVFRSHRVDHSSRLVFRTSRERQSRPQHLVGVNSD